MKPLFSGQFKIAESVPKGLEYEAVDKAFQPWNVQIEQKLPDTMTIEYQKAREITPMGMPVNVDEVVITGKSKFGTRLPDVKVRKHMPQSVQDFANQVIDVAMDLSRMPEAKLKEFMLLHRSVNQDMIAASANTFDGVVLPAKELKFTTFLEAVTHQTRPHQWEIKAEAEVVRPIFDTFTETIQLRQISETLTAFMERVREEASKLGEL